MERGGWRGVWFLAWPWILLPGHLLASLHMDTIGKLEQKVAALIDAALQELMPFLEHRKSCLADIGKPCDCGLESVLERWRPRQ